MVPVIFSLGPITISPLTILIPVAFLFASFFLWQSLKEDYPGEEVISLTIYLTLVFLIGARIIHILLFFQEFRFSLIKWLLINHYPGFSFLGGFLASSAFLIFWAKKKNWDFWELAEVIVPAWFLVAFLVGIGLYLVSAKIIFLAESFLAFLLFFLSHYLKRKYRSFTWYKSGKLGFVGCLTTSFYMIGKFLLEIYNHSGLYWEGIFLWGLAIACWVFIYLRSGRKPREDLGKISLLRKRRGYEETEY